MTGLTDEEEERVEPQPHIKANIDAIANIVDKNGLIDKAEEKAAKARGDLGRHYQKIENDYHGNRPAAKLVRRLLAGTTDAAYDFMRTFIPLAHHFGLIPEDDLAGGDPIRQVAEARARGEGEGILDLGAARRAREPSALDKVRDHLGSGTKVSEADVDDAFDGGAADDAAAEASAPPASDPPANDTGGEPAGTLREKMEGVQSRGRAGK